MAGEPLSPMCRVEVLGPPRLAFPASSGGTKRLERRTAALLAYVALEGPQPRSRMAGLLWPESSEKTARGNLRQLLHRLREAAGFDVLSAAEPLTLAGGVQLDAASPGDGELLEGVELDDVSEELAEWLRRTRAAMAQAKLQAGLTELERLEAAGDLSAALVKAQAILQLDPASEAAHRRLMRLHYLAGDRGAALAAYSRCRVALREGLGVEPSADTVALAGEISRGKRGPVRRSQAPTPIPLAVQRPPVLAGREREWAMMEEAWDAGKAIVIGGPPGIGKTRLMQDFMNSRSRPLFFTGRPGDRAIPYGTHARTYRELIDAIGGADALPQWARRELARVVPQLGDPPGPLASEEDKLRFWNAKIEAHRVAIARGFDALGFDDMQFVDPASVQAGTYVLSQLMVDPSASFRTVHCYRAGELPAETQQVLQEAASAGFILMFELQPIPEEGVSDLIASLGVPGLETLADQIARYAGGSPLFVLETVKHLLDSGELDRGFPDRLPPPGKVVAVLKARLDRLSPQALQLARALAVLGADFTLGLAAAVIDTPETQLIDAWAALESAHIVKGDGFSHDLVAETVLSEMAPPVRALLHRRVAEALTETGAAAGKIATHWLQAGEGARASASRRQAEAAARGTMLEHEAADYYRTAATGS